MKILMILFAVMFIVGCSFDPSVAMPDPSNAIPFADYLSANTDYDDVWVIGPDTHFVMRSHHPDVTINGTDYIDFTTINSYDFSMEYHVIVSVGDIATGTHVRITYQPSTAKTFEVN